MRSMRREKSLLLVRCIAKAIGVFRLEGLGEKVQGIMYRG